MNLVKTILMAATLAAASAGANAAITLEAGVPLVDQLDTYSLDRESELMAQGKAYRFAYGVAGIAGAEGTSAYVNSINTAYQMALGNAYTQLARELGTERIKASTSVASKSTDGGHAEQVGDCADKKKAADKAAAKDKDSWNNVLKSYVKGMTSDESESSASTEEEAVYECAAVLDKREIADIMARSVSDAFAGARIVESVVHEGALGVVIAVSPDTAVVAGVLAAQNPASNPNPAAFNELKTWLDGQLNAQTGSVIGLVGTRMTLLSNGEWGLVGFGVAPASEVAGNSILGHNRASNDRATSENNAARELSRFAGMSIDFNTKQETVDYTRKTVTKQLSGDNEKLVYAQDSAISRVVETSFNTQTQLDLKGARRIKSQRFPASGTTPAFYLTAYAWSPSLLAMATNFRDQMEASFDKGVQGDKKALSAPHADGEPSGSTNSAPVINEDW